MALPLALHPASLPAYADRRRPHLVSIEGGRSAAARRRQRTFLLRRCLAASVAALLGVVTVSALGALVGDGTPLPTAITVEPGDTLWQISGELDVGADRRQVVAMLAEANGGVVVVPGQRLVIPAALRAMGS